MRGDRAEALAVKAAAAATVALRLHRVVAPGIAAPLALAIADRQGESWWYPVAFGFAIGRVPGG